MEFSKSEIEILDLLAQGLSNREISAKRFTSVSTTKAHLIKIYRKMGLRYTEATRLKAILMYKELINGVE